VQGIAQAPASHRALNVMTVKNRYLIPLINDLINHLKGARFFTKLDIQWGFNNVQIRKGDEWKAVFRMNQGLFEPLVMYSGSTNSPATFQTMMNNIFQDLILSGDVMVYLDNILIAHLDITYHREIVQEVLRCLQEHKLFLRPEKCEFEKSLIEYLGVIISHDHMEMDLVKVAGVANWPTRSPRRTCSSSSASRTSTSGSSKASQTTLKGLLSIYDRYTSKLEPNRQNAVIHLFVRIMY
jgi:hypothetical protein